MTRASLRPGLRLAALGPVAVSLVLLFGASAATAASGWSITPTPSPGPSATGGILRGLSCTSATNCIAAGRFFTSTRTGGSTLIERWNGSVWTKVPSPDHAASSSSIFQSVACVSAPHCFAVGSWSAGAQTSTLIEHWNGTAWTLYPSPNPPGSLRTGLTSVACASGTDCTAVGTSDQGTDHESRLFLHFNGSAWSIVPAPQPANSVNTVNSVSCPATTTCFAVGSYVVQGVGGSNGFVERWDGSNWSIVAIPTPPATDIGLSSVSCRAANDCRLIGSHSGSGQAGVLSERWNGTSWTIESFPAAPNTTLLGVTCPTATTCWAVGAAPPSVSIWRWSAGVWTHVSSPSPAGASSYLGNVVCADTTNCVGVGGQVHGATNTLAEHQP